MKTFYKFGLVCIFVLLTIIAVIQSPNISDLYLASGAGMSDSVYSGD